MLAPINSRKVEQDQNWRSVCVRSKKFIKFQENLRSQYPKLQGLHVTKANGCQNYYQWLLNRKK